MGLQGWGVARTFIAQEHLARQHAITAGFETFHPRFKDYVIVKGRRRERVRSLFPAYMFFKIIDGRWWDLKRIPGIVDVLRDGESPAIVRPGEMDYLMQRFDEAGTRRLNDGRFKRGQKVRAIEGAFKDHVGTFQAMRPGDRVVVLFEMLGRVAPIEMGERELAAA